MLCCCFSILPVTREILYLSISLCVCVAQTAGSHLVVLELSQPEPEHSHRYHILCCHCVQQMSMTCVIEVWEVGHVALFIWWCEGLAVLRWAIQCGEYFVSCTCAVSSIFTQCCNLLLMLFQVCIQHHLQHHQQVHSQRFPLPLVHCYTAAGWVEEQVAALSDLCQLYLFCFFMWIKRIFSMAVNLCLI